MGLRKKSKKAEVVPEVVAEPTQDTFEEPPVAEVNLDEELDKVSPTTGLTRYQQYMRDKIKNAVKK